MLQAGKALVFLFARVLLIIQHQELRIGSSNVCINRTLSKTQDTELLLITRIVEVNQYKTEQT